MTLCPAPGSGVALGSMWGWAAGGVWGWEGAALWVLGTGGSTEMTSWLRLLKEQFGMEPGLNNCLCSGEVLMFESHPYLPAYWPLSQPTRLLLPAYPPAVGLLSYLPAVTLPTYCCPILPAKLPEIPGIT